MAKETVMEAWEPLFERYLTYMEQCGGSRPPAATRLEINHLQTTCERRGLVIDPSYLALLKKANGTGYDGLFFCGVNIPQKDSYGRIDLFDENDLIDERGDDTIYGLWQDEFFVQVASTGKFERRSVVTADAYHVYSRCEELLAAVLAEEVGYLEERFAAAAQ
jgi:hypothetical protein